MMPNYLLELKNSSTEEGLKSEIFQTWQKSGSCPKGTIPIRRIVKEDLLRAASLDNFGRKPPQQYENSTDQANGYVPENRSVMISINHYLLQLYVTIFYLINAA